MKPFKLLFAIIVLFVSGMATAQVTPDTLTLSDGHAALRHGNRQYPLIVEYNNPWQTLALTDRGFSAAEFFHYRIVLRKPSSENLQLYIGNEAEEKNNSGQTVDVKPGSRIIEGDFNTKAMHDGDLYVRMFRLQYTGSGKATVAVDKVELTSENGDIVAQRPAVGTWNFDHNASRD